MAASLAACGHTVGVHNDLVTFANRPISKPPICSYSVGSNLDKYVLVSTKSRSPYSVIPKASATAVEMSALQNLGLNVVKANVHLDSSGKHTKFSITKASTSRKVEDPELLEAIRLTIIRNLLHYHPESSAQLAMGEAFGIEAPKHKVDVDIATRIHVYDDGPNRSLLTVETTYRPGLLVDLVKIFTDINVTVESGEFDTEGLLAKAKFHVNYKGKSLSEPLQQFTILFEENNNRGFKFLNYESKDISEPEDPITKRLPLSAAFALC